MKARTATAVLPYYPTTMRAHLIKYACGSAKAFVPFLTNGAGRSLGASVSFGARHPGRATVSTGPLHPLGAGRPFVAS